jgi:hypothetical protein
MDCKHIKGTCPEYCISYKRDKKKHCRTPPKTTRSSNLSRRLIKYGLSQHSTDINSPLYNTYINIHGNLSRDEIKLLKVTLKHLEGELEKLSKDDQIRLLTTFDLGFYIRLGKRIANREEIDNILNILGIYKTNSIIDIYNILLVVLLDEKEFIEKYKSLEKLNITQKKLMEYLVNKPIDPKVFFSNPIIKAYIKLKEELSEYELTELENKLADTFKNINRLKGQGKGADIIPLLESENFCQYIRKAKSQSVNEQDIDNYLISLGSEDTVTAKKATKCYILASIISTDEEEVVKNYTV